MNRRRGDYGYDAPYVLAAVVASTLLAFAAAGVLFAFSLRSLSIAAAVVGLAFALSALSYVWTTRRGKFLVWDELLEGLALRGDERILDVGCGRGAVLLLIAERLPRGQAVGIDLWSTADQSGNSEKITLHNAELEGVRDRIELRTADMRRLPFPDQSFDLIVSSLAIHNVRDVQGRAQALAEILRTLKRGGTVLIADIRHTAEYERYFSAQSGTRVERSSLGWRFWYGGPQFATALVRVRKA